MSVFAYAAATQLTKAIQAKRISFLELLELYIERYERQPTGLAKDGLPVEVQIGGPYLEDRTPIHVAKLIEEISGGFSPSPGFE